MAAQQPYVINQKAEQTRTDRYRWPRSLRAPYPTDNRQTRLDLGSHERVEIRNQKYSSRRTQIMAPLDIWYTAYLLKRLTHTILHVWWPSWKTFTANSLTYSARFSNIMATIALNLPLWPVYLMVFSLWSTPLCYHNKTLKNAVKWLLWKFLSCQNFTLLATPLIQERCHFLPPKQNTADHFHR